MLLPMFLAVFRLKHGPPQLRVSGFDPSQISGWTLFTADASDYIVDGTPQSGGLGL